MLILATGATGKVGRNFIARLLEDSRFAGARVRALCHNRTVPQSERVEVVRGSIAARGAVAKAVAGVTHVAHLATCKETPDDVMDVTVKGLFWLLEEFRLSPTARQFILIGGDAGVGHYFHRHDGPVAARLRRCRPRRFGDGRGDRKTSSRQVVWVLHRPAGATSQGPVPQGHRHRDTAVGHRRRGREGDRNGRDRDAPAG